MRKIILVFGSIAGAIVGGMLLITVPLYEKGILKIGNGEWLGFTTMIIGLSLIFFGVKSYRDGELDGVITFGKGLKVGVLIAVLASLIYAVSWEIAYNTMSGDFKKQYNDARVETLKSQGISEVKLQEEMKRMEENAMHYKNPFIRFGITLMEIFPVGMLIALLSAALLKRKKFLPSTR